MLKLTDATSLLSTAFGIPVWTVIFNFGYQRLLDSFSYKSTLHPHQHGLLIIYIVVNLTM